jgi:hypothetical protein
MLHTIFDKIYILNFNHEIYKWFKCEENLKMLGITGERLGISGDDDGDYKKWISKSNKLKKMSIEMWCISRKIIKALINNNTKCDRILFLTADICFHTHFETELYNLLSINDGIDNHLFCGGKNKDSFVSISVPKKIFELCIAKFEVSPTPIVEIISNLLPKTDEQLLLFNNNNNVEENILTDHTEKYSITVIVYLFRKLFFLPIFQDVAIKLLSQNYPYWSCVFVTEEFSIDDGVNKIVLDLGKKFSLVESKEPKELKEKNKISTKYLLSTSLSNNQNIFKEMSSTFFSEKVYNDFKENEERMKSVVKF